MLKNICMYGICILVINVNFKIPLISFTEELDDHYLPSRFVWVAS